MYEECRVLTISHQIIARHKLVLGQSAVHDVITLKKTNSKRYRYNVVAMIITKTKHSEYGSKRQNRSLCMKEFTTPHNMERDKK